MAQSSVKIVYFPKYTGVWRLAALLVSGLLLYTIVDTLQHGRYVNALAISLIGFLIVSIPYGRAREKLVLTQNGYWLYNFAAFKKFIPLSSIVSIERKDNRRFGFVLDNGKYIHLGLLSSISSGWNDAEVEELIQRIEQDFIKQKKNAIV